MANRISIRKFLENYEAGIYGNPDVQIQIEAGWYDWFCNEKSLRNKTLKLAKKLKSILPSDKIDIDKHYVWFKNNCPMYGSLYDDFRIARLEDQEPLYCIIPSNGHDSIKGRCSVYDIQNPKNGDIVFNSWKELTQWFKTSEGK